MCSQGGHHVHDSLPSLSEYRTRSVHSTGIRQNSNVKNAFGRKLRGQHKFNKSKPKLADRISILYIDNSFTR